MKPSMRLYHDSCYKIWTYESRIIVHHFHSISNLKLNTIKNIYMKRLEWFDVDRNYWICTLSCDTCEFLYIKSTITRFSRSFSKRKFKVFIVSWEIFLLSPKRLLSISLKSKKSFSKDPLFQHYVALNDEYEWELLLVKDTIHR